MKMYFLTTAFLLLSLSLTAAAQESSGKSPLHSYCENGQSVSEEQFLSDVLADSKLVFKIMRASEGSANHMLYRLAKKVNTCKTESQKIDWAQDQVNHIFHVHNSANLRAQQLMAGFIYKLENP